MNDRRNALLWALGWWLFRRQMRRRASEALAGISAVATPKRRFGALGGLLIVGLAVGAFVAWRRLAGDGRLGGATVRAGARSAAPDARRGVTLPEPGRSPGQAGARRLPRQPDPAEPGAAIAARLGLDRVVSLGLNEGQCEPLSRGARGARSAWPSLNRYPTRGSSELAQRTRGTTAASRRTKVFVTGRRGCGDRVRLPGAASIPATRRRPVAVVPELRPRHREARCRARARPALRLGHRRRRGSRRR